MASKKEELKEEKDLKIKVNKAEGSKKDEKEKE